jgi:hypothetical protein
MLSKLFRSGNYTVIVFWCTVTFSSLAIFTLILGFLYNVSIPLESYSSLKGYDYHDEAIVTYLSRQHDATPNAMDDEDNYFVGARILAY